MSEKYQFTPPCEGQNPNENISCNVLKHLHNVQHNKETYLLFNVQSGSTVQSALKKLQEYERDRTQYGWSI